MTLKRGTKLWNILEVVPAGASRVLQAGLPITGNWTTTQKTRRIFHGKKSVLVLYYSFFERSPNLSEIFFGWEKNIFNFFPGKNNNILTLIQTPLEK